MTLTDFNKAYEGHPKWKDSLVRLIGIRGYNETMGKIGNDINIYDDAIVRCMGDQVDLFPASTDPGQYYVDHPLNPAGCAQLQVGLWQYELGIHHNIHPALVQASEVKLWRLDSHGKKHDEQTGYFGINIHSGGDEYEVGRYSAGCQVIQDKDGAWSDTWERFFNPLKKVMQSSGQKIVPYLLTEAL